MSGKKSVVGKYKLGKLGHKEPGTLWGKVGGEFGKEGPRSQI